MNYSSHVSQPVVAVVVAAGSGSRLRAGGPKALVELGGEPLVRRSVEAMRLGAVKYIVPFGFALNPALVAQASGGEILLAFPLSVVAVYAVAGALGGYLAVVERRLPVWARVALAVSGFMMFLPQLWVTLLGLAFTAAVVAVVRLAVPGDLPPEPVEDSGEAPRLPTRAAS